MNGPLVKFGRIMFRAGRMVMTAAKTCCCNTCGWWPATACTILGSGCGQDATNITVYADGCLDLAHKTIKVGDRCYRIQPKIPTLPEDAPIVTIFQVVQDCDSEPCPSLAGTHRPAHACMGQGDPPPIFICPECIGSKCFGFTYLGFCYWVDNGPLVNKPPDALEGRCLLTDPPNTIRIGPLGSLGNGPYLKVYDFKCCTCVNGCNSVTVTVLDGDGVTGNPFQIECCCGGTGASRSVTYSYRQRVDYLLEDPSGATYTIIRASGTLSMVNGAYVGPCSVDVISEYHGPNAHTTVEPLVIPFYGCGGIIDGVCNVPGGLLPFREYGVFPNPGVSFIGPSTDGSGNCTGTVSFNARCHRGSGQLHTRCFIQDQTAPRVTTDITVEYVEALIGQCTGGCGQESAEAAVIAANPSTSPLAFGFL